MNKKILVMLLVVALAISAAAIGTAAAVTTTQSIEFDLEGYGYSYYPVTNTYESVEVSAVVNGNVKDRDGKYYLSPLTGTITIDDVEYQIQVKGIKQSEPVIYEEDSWDWHYNDCYWYYSEYERWTTVSEINIEGRKCIGNLNWYQEYYKGMSSCNPYEGY